MADIKEVFHHFRDSQQTNLLWSHLSLNASKAQLHFSCTLPLQFIFSLESALLFYNTPMSWKLRGEMKHVHTSFTVFSFFWPKLWSNHILVIQVLDWVQHRSVSTPCLLSLFFPQNPKDWCLLCISSQLKLEKACFPDLYDFINKLI